VFAQETQPEEHQDHFTPPAPQAPSQYYYTPLAHNEPSGQDFQVSQAPNFSVDSSFQQPPEEQYQNVNQFAISQGQDVPQYICGSCLKGFPQRHKLNTHAKSHTRPFKCEYSKCDSAFQYRKDLIKHINCVHHEHASQPRRFFCPEEGCKHSRTHGKFFKRNDNYKRHVRSQHPHINV